MLYAHSRNDAGERQSLCDHLVQVAELAAQHAAAFGQADLAYDLGLYHDLGKAHPEWQRYLLASEEGRRLRSPGHSAAGTVALSEKMGPLAMVVQGHHGGLRNPQDLRKLATDAGQRQRLAESLAAIGDQLIPRGASAHNLPNEVNADKYAAEMMLRMLHSCLVDADYGDTGAHDGQPPAAPYTDFDTLWERFSDHMRGLSHRGDDPVSRVRDTIHAQCLQAAEGPVGLYRLTVPTGGGKTLSSLGFALRHAIKHGLERIIIAIPYISITEQTAKTLRQALEREGTPPVVLEHHSAVDIQEDEERGSWLRLASETWDVPVVVTTSVRLFESLFANRGPQTRRLHRLAKSLLILDEVQSLPLVCLDPILDALRQLPTLYGSTVVLSTATQPAFDEIAALRALPAQEMVPDPGKHYAALQRVRYDIRLDETLGWDAVADELLAASQSMAILNTKADAQALFQRLRERDTKALHLSAAMCGAHRRAVLDEVERRLAAGETCHLVATQVVEAGVDIDFALVMRAMAPLDSLIQAAGRCNREGRLQRGRVIVFETEEGHSPPGSYARGTNISRGVLRDGLDPSDPDAARDYFLQLYDVDSLDRDPPVQSARGAFDYPETAKRFRMIDDASVSVVVPYGDQEDKNKLNETLSQLARHWGNPRQLMRSLQPYLVSLHHGQLQRQLAAGRLTEVVPGLYEWGGAYDPDCGLIPEDLSPQDLTV